MEDVTDKELLEVERSNAKRFRDALRSAYRVAKDNGGNPRHGEFDTDKAIGDIARRKDRLAKAAQKAVDWIESMHPNPKRHPVHQALTEALNGKN